MLVRRRRGWELPEREATPEAMFLGRRELIKAAAAGSMLLPGVFSSFAAAAEEDSVAEAEVAVASAAAPDHPVAVAAAVAAKWHRHSCLP